MIIVGTRDWWMLVSRGALGVLFGIALILFRLAGAISLIWLIDSYGRFSASCSSFSASGYAARNSAAALPAPEWRDLPAT